MMLKGRGWYANMGRPLASRQVFRSMRFIGLTNWRAS